MASSLALRVASALSRDRESCSSWSSPRPTDGQLIARVADGDRAAFDELYRRYARAVLGSRTPPPRRPRACRGRRAGSLRRDLAVGSNVRPARGPRRSVALRGRTERDHRRLAPHTRARRRARGRARQRSRSGRSRRGVVDGVAGPSRARGAAGPRASGDRARVLARPLTERDRRCGSVFRSER